MEIYGRSGILPLLLLFKRIVMIIFASVNLSKMKPKLTLSEPSRLATTIIKREARDRRERLAIRDRMLVARKYYWEELMRRRPDDVTAILAEKEFFVDDRTIQNALLRNADFYNDLCRRHVTAKQLAAMFPSWRF